MSAQVHDPDRSSGRFGVVGRQRGRPQGADRRSQSHRGAQASRARQVRLRVRGRGRAVVVRAQCRGRVRAGRPPGHHQPAEEVLGRRGRLGGRQDQDAGHQEAAEGRAPDRIGHRAGSRGRRGRGRSGVTGVRHLRDRAVPEVLHGQRCRRRDIRISPRLHRQLRPGRVQQIRNAAKGVSYRPPGKARLILRATAARSTTCQSIYFKLYIIYAHLYK